MTTCVIYGIKTTDSIVERCKFLWKGLNKFNKLFLLTSGIWCCMIAFSILWSSSVYPERQILQPVKLPFTSLLNPKFQLLVLHDCIDYFWSSSLYPERQILQLPFTSLLNPNLPFILSFHRRVYNTQYL